MAKQEWVVRVSETYHSDPREGSKFGQSKMLDLLIECLDYAGVVRHIERAGMIVFDIRCPKGLDSQVWSQQNAGRMKSFGFNAVAAPKQP